MDGAREIPDYQPDGAQSFSTKPNAIDLQHHLSLLARSRQESPLKSMFKYAVQPGMRMLAGGLPSPDYFPFDSISAQALAPNTYKQPKSGLSWFFSLFSTPSTTTITIPKYVENATPFDVQLSTALQYSQATGLPALQKFVKDFTARVYDPAYADFETLLNIGSTSAWSLIVPTFCERGDGILCEEWTYPSALAAAWPGGVKPVPIAMDGEGMTPESMEEILATWDPTKRGGMKRPTILYTIPVTQNPTGATMTVKRKKQIYEIACKYDVVIVEDDPYYFLQAGEYEPREVRAKKVTNQETDGEFLASLVPSYLRFDYQGRVIRIDTFSKTVAPGSRLGWTTANPLFIERILRAAECSTQAPCGFGQALITKLLVEEWGLTGYIRWLKGLKVQYRERRDMMVDTLLDQAHAGLEARQKSNGSFVLTAAVTRDEKGFAVPSGSQNGIVSSEPILSFVAPEGGMFVWLRIHLSLLPPAVRAATTSAELLNDLWEALAKANVLLAPGTMFSARTFGTSVTNPTEELSPPPEEVAISPEGDGFFRVAFSTASPELMKESMTIVAKTTKSWFAQQAAKGL